MNYNKINSSSQSISSKNLDDFDFSSSKIKHQNDQIKDIFDKWDDQLLDNDFREKSKCLQSTFLPINYIAENLSNKIVNLPNDEVSVLYKEYIWYYTKFLQEHWCFNTEIAKNWLNDEISPDIWWKFHLNIRPEHVMIIDRYLKNSGFKYKFLSWGDIDQWKIFTIYIGSYSLMKRLAIVLNRDIWKYLCRPQSTCNDIEFAPWVVWRFSYKGGSKEWFNREDKYGFPMKRALKSLWDKKMELISYRILKEKFWDYFHK